MEQRNSNKTIMSSVLFLDIVEYSKESVVGQISLKERFNRFLSEGLCKVPEADRIILDTGDGAAVSFIGDIEEALQVSLSMREHLLNQDPAFTPLLRIRIGINLGPVRLVRDINGQPNIVGDGINVAQRIMGFAGENEILMSRSYYDAISQYSEHYKEMVRFKGSQTDKHVRAHEIYVVRQPGEVAASSPAPTESTKSKLPIYIGGGVIAVGIIAGLVFSNSGSDPASGQALPVDSAISSISVPPASVAVVSSTHAESTVTPASDTQHHKVVGNNKANNNDKATKANKPATSATVAAPTKAPSKATPIAAQMGEGRITIGCAEGSKVFIDGSNQGKVGTVPLTLTVGTGTHLVVVDSPNRLISQHVTVDLNQTVRVGSGACN